jgi:protein involved in polysaccharide export with SLBB domain
MTFPPFQPGRSSKLGGPIRSALSPLLACLLFAALHAQDSGQTVSPSKPRQLDLPATDTVIPRVDGVDTISPQPWTSGRYRLTPSDVLELRFPYVPEFDQTVAVQPDGYISLRALGDLRVQGRSLPELKAMLNEAYAGILREPVINIILREFEKPYFIAAGEVARPGKYELRGATTLTQGLVLAGGHTRAAKHSQVILFRRFSTEWLEVKQVDVKKMYATRNLGEDPLLRPGDTIFVPRSVLSYIAPFIPRPGLGLYLNPLSR